MSQVRVDSRKLAFVEPNSIRIEQEVNQSIIDSLKLKGHNITKGRIGNATGIKIIRKNGKIIHFDVGIDKRGEGRNAIVDH